MDGNTNNDWKKVIFANDWKKINNDWKKMGAYIYISFYREQQKVPFSNSLKERFDCFILSFLSFIIYHVVKCHPRAGRHPHPPPIFVRFAAADDYDFDRPPLERQVLIAGRRFDPTGTIKSTRRDDRRWPSSVPRRHRQPPNRWRNCFAKMGKIEIL
jgi:hypothetical protein